MSRFWAAYNRALVERPLLARCATVSGLAIVGDVMSQSVEKRLAVRAGRPAPSHSFARTVRMATFGFCLAGPANHFWYGALDKLIVGTTARHTVTKVVLDQAVFAPAILSVFFCSMSLMEGHSWTEAKQNWRNLIFGALKLNYLVWPAAQAVNFKFVPAQHRVGYVSVVLMFWNSVISYLHHKPESTAAGDVAVTSSSTKKEN